VVPDGLAGAGGTILLLQKWVHDVAAWEALTVEEQERAMGRTKPDSVELDGKRPDSHIATTDQELTRYTRPVSGAYYFVPSIGALRQRDG
jgi:porphyrinogen peroxidase